MDNVMTHQLLETLLAFHKAHVKGPVETKQFVALLHTYAEHFEANSNIKGITK